MSIAPPAAVPSPGQDDGCATLLGEPLFLTQMERRLNPLPRAIAAATAQQMRREGGRDWPWLHLDSIKRQLDRDALEYRQ